MLYLRKYQAASLTRRSSWLEILWAEYTTASREQKNKRMNSSNQKSSLRWFLLLWLGLIYVQNLQAGVQNLNPGAKVPLPGTVNSPQLDPYPVSK